MEGILQDGKAEGKDVDKWALLTDQWNVCIMEIYQYWVLEGKEVTSELETWKQMINFVDLA